ncbi:MAG TPA: hypothetical protein VMB25_08525 [Bryobacteraceae bacterium]|nr:hypothetical protein [Bryobacteraceae bacterium]
MRMTLAMAALLLLNPRLSPAAHLSRPAEQAFESYITNLEARWKRQHAASDTCLAALPPAGASRADAERKLLAGVVLAEPVHGGSWEVDGGLLHHWRAASYVPGAGLADMLALLHDDSQLSRYYAPEIVSSRSPDGDGTVLIRFRRQLVITVVLDAAFDTESAIAGDCGYSFSRSEHIWQVDDPGNAREHRRQEGADDGFLWRLNSYWSFQEWRQGLLIECEAVSLTRGVPAGLGWLLAPIIQTLPRNSLEFTLTSTRNALAHIAMGGHTDASAN